MGHQPPYSPDETHNHFHFIPIFAADVRSWYLVVQADPLSSKESCCMILPQHIHHHRTKDGLCRIVTLLIVKGFSMLISRALTRSAILLTLSVINILPAAFLNLNLLGTSFIADLIHETSLVSK